MIMSIRTNFICITLMTLSLGFFGCKDKSKSFDSAEQIPQISLNSKNGSHKWYYFTRTDYKPIDKIQNVPYSPLTPWTEAVRISSANCATTAGENKAFAVVNRLGIISFNGEEKQLSKDENIFTDRTAGNLIFLNETPIFSVFKSAFFNDTIKDYKYSAADAQHLFLIQFDPQSRISYPIINCNNLVKLPNSEVIDYYWDGINWTCCVKTISDVKTDFTYINWKPVPSLLTLSPVNANSNISVTESTQDEFRAKKEQLDYKFAPERIKKLLAGFSKKTSFAIDVKTSGGSSWRNYKNTVDDSKELYATAIIAQTWSAALFEDGTLFLEGALPGKHILRGGKPVAIRLPRLPMDYVYSDFVISGTTLYAAWEETAFFKTGRSGFVEINLNKSLYSKL